MVTLSAQGSKHDHLVAAFSRILPLFPFLFIPPLCSSIARCKLPFFLLAPFYTFCLVNWRAAAAAATAVDDADRASRSTVANRTVSRSIRPIWVNEPRPKPGLAFFFFFLLPPLPPLPLPFPFATVFPFLVSE